MNMRLPTKPVQFPTTTPTFPSPPRKLHTSGNHFRRCLLAAHYLEQPSHVGRSEEMCADDELGPETAEAISSMLRVEVLLARMASGLQT